MRCIRVVIADHHPVFLQGLSSVLEASCDFRMVARCRDGASCLEAIRAFLPDIAVLGASISDMSGPEILANANSENPPTRLAFFTASVDARQMLAAAGALGVIPNDVNPEMLVQILRDIADGQTSVPPLPSGEIGSPEQSSIAQKPLTALTDRQRQIMQLVSEGLSNKEIARRLNLTGGTIKVHLHHMFQKLEIRNRTALAALALSQNEGAVSLAGD